MALIQCPECGKEISDKAKNCPNCGYVLPHFKLPHYKKNEKLKRYTKIVGICVISFLVLFLAFLLIKMNIKEHSPFEKFNSKTTKTDVQKIYGKLQSKSNEDIYNVSFVGLKGELYVWYDDDEILRSATWFFQCVDGKRQSDYSRQVDKIKKILTKQYGAARKNKPLLENSPIEWIEWIEWEDTSGQNISLNDDKDAFDICLIYHPQ